MSLRGSQHAHVNRQLMERRVATVGLSPTRPPILFNYRCRECGAANRRAPEHRAHTRRVS